MLTKIYNPKLITFSKKHLALITKIYNGMELIYNLKNLGTIIDKKH